MNAVWNAWIDKQNKPTRVCVEAPMARPSILVEVQVTAAA
jgi:enamine deaminase RidA (YjgF/YER057c/UK114 family)